jgi:hypothetical protein
MVAPPRFKSAVVIARGIGAGAMKVLPEQNSRDLRGEIAKLRLFEN